MKMAYYSKPKHAVWFVTNEATGVCQLRGTERATISELKTIVIIHSLFLFCLYFAVGNLLKLTPFFKVAPVLNLALRH